MLGKFDPVRFEFLTGVDGAEDPRVNITFVIIDLPL